MGSLFQSVSINSNGVDYICSDIHGHFSLLKALLDKVNFDPSKDRLFSLGDLIDRGPECEEVLKWLRYEWFYAIQGNHERMLINAVEQKSSHVFMQWHAWGGSWAEDFDLVELQEYYQVLSNLPVAIELQVSGSKKVALVHAELPDQCDWLDVIDQLASVDKKDVEKNRLVSDMFWKKSQLYRDPEGFLSIKPVRNIDHVFHGHTIVDFITTHANRTFMDLGSYLNDDIGLVKPTDYV